jgi:hypothetical protein
MNKVTQIKFLMLEKGVKSERELAGLMGISPQKLNTVMNCNKVLDRAIGLLEGLK